MEQTGGDIALLQAMMATGQVVSTLVLNVPGYGDVEFRYKPLGYIAKSKCVSEATEYIPSFAPDGKLADIKSVFRMDIYKRSALREMFGDRSLGNKVPITDKLVESMSEELGAQFDEVIPDPFGTATKIGSLKKEQDNSDETEEPDLTTKTS